MRRSVSLSLGVAVVAAAGLTMAPALAAPKPAPHPPSVQTSVVVTGLDNPKHLAFGPDGHLYVAETGVGDPTKTRCVPVIGDTGQPTQDCVGPTGSVARITGHSATPVLTGLASVQSQDTGETLGAAAVSFYRGSLVVIMQDADVQADGTTGLPGGAELGKGVFAAPGSSRSSWALFPDLAAFASEHPQTDQGGTPGETAYDSDPYGIAPYRGGFAVVDAAANSLLWVSPLGQVQLVARFPAVPEPLGPTTVQAQAVPTSVAVGPDGALYVGGLRGVPSAPGTADVYRVVPGHAPTVWATGFSAITDLAFDAHGRLLVLEYNTGGLLGTAPDAGALVRVNADHKSATTVKAGLSNPTGLAVGHDGAVYVANDGTAAGTASPSGEVIELTGDGVTGGSTHHGFRAPTSWGSVHGSWFSTVSHWW
jgi:hypothetical protein